MISSTILSKTPQADGSLSVHERHVDSLGKQYDLIYMAPAGADLAARMTSSSAKLDAEAKDRELRDVLFCAKWDASLNFATPAELLVYVRAAYKAGERDELVLIAARILEWIANGRLTDVQARNAFGLNATQWTNLKTKMTNFVTSYNAIQTAVGE